MCERNAELTDAPRLPAARHLVWSPAFIAMWLTCALLGAGCGKASEPASSREPALPSAIVPGPGLWGVQRAFVSPSGRYVAAHSVPAVLFGSAKPQVSLLLDLQTQRVTQQVGIVLGPPSDDGTLCLLRRGDEIATSKGRKLQLRTVSSSWPLAEITRIVASPQCQLVVLESRTAAPGQAASDGGPDGSNTELLAFDLDGNVRWRHREQRQSYLSPAGLAISADGALAAYTSDDGVVVVDARTGELRYQHSDPALTSAALRFDATQTAVLAFTGPSLWRLDFRKDEPPERLALGDSFDAFAEARPGTFILLRTYLTHGSQLATPHWICTLSELTVERGSTVELWHDNDERCTEVLARLPDGRVLLPSR